MLKWTKSTITIVFETDCSRWQTHRELPPDSAELKASFSSLFWFSSSQLYCLHSVCVVFGCRSCFQWKSTKNWLYITYPVEHLAAREANIFSWEQNKAKKRVNITTCIYHVDTNMMPNECKCLSVSVMFK